MKDDYTLVCRLLGGGLIVVAIGWTLEHGPALREAWKDYRQRAADLRRVKMAPPGLKVAFLVPPGTLNVRDRVVFSTQPLLKREAPAGTVQNPSDPSPQPHVQRFGSKFPR